MTIAIPLTGRRGAVLAFAIAFFIFGFAIDGTSEIGHHAGLIAGGIFIGRSFHGS
jgi:hypothetical protein